VWRCVRAAVLKLPCMFLGYELVCYHVCSMPLCPQTQDAIEEVGGAVDEGKNEHDLLAAFASGLDAPLE
jgi:hypothetical protein